MSLFGTAPHPIRSVLIANRGEIACRVIRTCRRLGLHSVAVYSDADADALHVRSADEAHRIGPASASASYLNIDAILLAARISGADAVHPGYGFLSENAAFVRRCEEAGLVFIGPSHAAVAAMGSKIEAKKLARKAGVPVVPGYSGDDQSDDRLAAAADEIGYPVLIKASSGGGGRGMRLVEHAHGFASALRAAKAESQAAFGDDAVLLEKFVPDPRHLEVQLVGDAHGNLVHLFERDCSVQRNNQKILEEAPAPNLPQEVRDQLFKAALTLGRAIGYRSAGTVEFIMEAGGSTPFFLEMNTRLQVEHPVTEAITGIDLVEWQLRVAAGLALPLRQEQIRASGHAIEARLAAERPDAGFQPSIGRFVEVTAPAGVRLDTSVASGSEVGLYYDSMIAKLIAHGPDRSSALARLVGGLDGLALLGPATNQAFLKACLQAPDFADGRATTRFIAANFPDGWQPPPTELSAIRALAAVLWAGGLGGGSAGPWQRRDGFRTMGARRQASIELQLVDEYGTAAIRLSRGAGGFAALVDGLPVSLDAAGAGVPVHGHVIGEQVHVSRGGLSLAARITPTIDVSRQADMAAGGRGGLVAPLPGLVTTIAVKPGDLVEKGDTLLQMEAMKLVHTLTAPHGGRVSAVHCAAGETVAAGTKLVEIAADEEN